ncbi:hypothetical protein V1477_011484 [Vespula maculifrons]|uniref:Uncharacterized protein n=1 Tax=Vespula maculifrons TaxID=7453 RepID=A0ABD2BZB6_VESMC
MLLTGDLILCWNVTENRFLVIATIFTKKNYTNIEVILYLKIFGNNDVTTYRIDSSKNIGKKNESRLRSIGNYCQT